MEDWKLDALEQRIYAGDSINIKELTSLVNLVRQLRTVNKKLTAIIKRYKDAE